MAPATPAKKKGIYEFVSKLESLESVSDTDFRTAALLTEAARKPYCPFQALLEDEQPPVKGKESPKKKAITKCQTKCRENPNCLNSVGAELWTSKDALENFLEAQGLGEEDNPGREHRIGPVGLRNLGATCYLNTLIQNWFSLESFRKGVQMYRPMTDMETPSDNIIRQLQHTFAFLEHSIRDCYDPTPFVESMDLRPGIQQDSQEFSKLLLSLMDSSFQDQKDPRVKSLVKDHFQGQYTYVTQCQFCQQESPRPCSFFELELRISECRSIQESLLCFTGAEYLTGDNQYFCSSCQTKRDALRFIRIEAVPPVLNLQLMRFVFDMESLTKKKLRNKIVFPETLDMRPYVASASDEPLLYDLKAVLLHRGSTADSGHYVVRIRDTPQDSINSMTDSNGPSSSNPPKSDSNWFDFDDESVTPMDKVVFELDEGTSSGASTTTTPKKSSAKKRKVKEDEVPLNLNPGEFASATAYLLTYVRRSHSYQVESVPEIMDVVHASNVVFENECDTYDKRKNEQTRVFIEKQSMLKSLFSSWSVSCDSQQSYNVDSGALRTFLESDFEKKKKDNVKSGFPTSPTVTLAHAQNVTLDNTPLLCSHLKLDVDSMSTTKRISQSGYDVLTQLGYSINPVLKTEDICHDCFIQQVRTVYWDLQHERDTATLRSFKYKKDEPKFAISKAWLQEWSKKVPMLRNNETGVYTRPDAETYRQDFICKHGGVLFDPEKVKWISEEKRNFFQTLFEGLECLSETIEPCSECTQNAQDEAALLKQQRQSVRSLISDVELPILSQRRYYMVSTDFRDAWLKYIHGKRPAPSTIENKSLFCQHDKLLYDLNQKSDRENPSFRLVTGDEWEILLTKFQVDREVTASTFHGELRGVGRIETSVPVCHACRKERLVEYAETFIFIRKRPGVAQLSETDRLVQDFAEPLDEIPAAVNDDVIVVEDETRDMDTDFVSQDSVVTQKEKLIPTITDSIVRQSQRIRQSDFVQIQISKWMKVRHLKSKLIRHFDAVPSAMALYRNGKELSDDDATMEFYKVMPQDILDLGLRSAKEIKEQKRKIEGPEIGFSGTGLLVQGGYVKDHPNLSAMTEEERWDETLARRLQDEEEEQANMSPRVVAHMWVWTCPQCTFVNDGRDNCEMCEFTPKA